MSRRLFRGVGRPLMLLVTLVGSWARLCEAGEGSKEIDAGKRSINTGITLEAREIKVVRGLTGGCRFVGFGSDCNVLITAHPGFDRKTRSFQIADGKEVWSFASPSDLLRYCAISPDGKLLVNIVSRERKSSTIRITDTENGKELLSESGPIYSKFVFGPEKGEFVTLGSRSIQYWKYDSEGRIEKQKLVTENLPTSMRDITPDLKRAVSSSSNGQFSVWDIPSKQMISKVKLEDRSLDEYKISPDGNWILRWAIGGKIQIRNANSGEPVTALEPTPIGLTAFSPNSKWLVTDMPTKTGGGVVFWELATGRKVLKLEVSEPFAGSIAFNSRGDMFAATSSGAWYVWGLKEKAQ